MIRSEGLGPFEKGEDDYCRLRERKVSEKREERLIFVRVGVLRGWGGRRLGSGLLTSEFQSDDIPLHLLCFDPSIELRPFDDHQFLAKNISQDLAFGFDFH